MNQLLQYIKFTAAATGLLALSVVNANASGLLTAKNSPTQLQIQDHQVSVMIEDGYAITTVENTFFNPSSESLEGVYEFPVPNNGTIAEFTIWIDDKAVVGEVVEKERAKKLYEQEKAAGRDAGLTEKKSFYRFESSVSPIRPQQATKTRLVYMQPADVEGGIGRYVYPLEEGGTDQDKLDFWQTDDKVHGQFSFDLSLRSGFPVDAVRAPAHPHATISNSDLLNWKVSINTNGNSKPITAIGENGTSGTERTAVFSDLAVQNNLVQSNAEQNTTERNQASNALNQDMVVYWRLQPNLPGAIELITHKLPDQRRGTFMLTVTPGIDLQAITEGRDWVFVLDRSGSMSSKYQTLMDATALSLAKLQSNDRFRIILFSNTVEELTKGWTEVDDISLQRVSDALSRSNVDGGTNLYAGLSKAVSSLDSDRTSSIVLITDGVANVGKTEKKDFLDLMAKYDVRLFTAIMGNGANRPLLESMTKVSQGFSTSISNSDDTLGIIIGAIEKVKYQALHDVDLSIKGLKTSDLVPTQPTTLYRGQQMVMFGHYYGDEQATVTLKAKISGQETRYSSTFNFPKESTTNPEIERLWAYAQIQELKDRADYLGTSTEDYRSAIVDTAVEYGLVTDFTSMIVMSDEQFAANGIDRQNRDRRETEEKATALRASTAVTSNRVDQNDPAFTDTRPNYSGGGSGSINPISLLMLLPILIAWLRNRRPALRNPRIKDAQ